MHCAPTQPSGHRIADIRDNLIARIAEADREGWLGEVEGLKISLAGARDKLAQIDRRSAPAGPVTSACPPPPSQCHTPANKSEPATQPIRRSFQVQRMRSLAISLLRLDGQTNIAAANRHHARDPQRTLQLLQTA